MTRRTLAVDVGGVLYCNAQSRRRRTTISSSWAGSPRTRACAEAAAFAHAAGVPLTVAGPAWEKDYLDALLADFPHTVRYVGEVGGMPVPD